MHVHKHIRTYVLPRLPYAPSSLSDVRVTLKGTLKSLLALSMMSTLLPSVTEYVVGSNPTVTAGGEVEMSIKE